MKRYTTTNTGTNTCTVKINSGFHAGTERRYWAPADGGYVREVDDAHPGTLGGQVIDSRIRNGSTLSWDPSQGPLSTLMSDQVRRELNAEDIA